MNEPQKLIRRNLKTVLVFFLVAAAGLGFATSDAFAQGGGFYVGFTSDIDYIRVKHRKSTINNPNTGALHEGKTFHDSDSASRVAFGGGLLAGYRLNLGETGAFYVSAELDGQLDARSVSGTLPGQGDTPTDHRQSGASWPDDWNLERKYSYGATIKLGRATEFLGSGSSVYVLGGARRVRTRLKVDYLGCPMFDKPCTSSDQYRAGSYSQNDSLWGWTAGAGVEKMIADRVGIRGEIRHTRYEKVKRLDVLRTLRVPASNEHNETGLSLGAVVYF